MLHLQGTASAFLVHDILIIVLSFPEWESSVVIVERNMIYALVLFLEVSVTRTLCSPDSKIAKGISLNDSWQRIGLPKDVTF